MEMIARGAEAILYMDSWEGQKVLVKERVKKGYRIKQIDEKIRRERTKKEVKLLTGARKIGVSTPQILHIDKKECKIIMQFIDGIRIKEFLNTASDEKIEKICEDVGRLVGKLHAANIVHGDLTTSNMILCKTDNKIYFIDFGLGDFSRRIEDRGVDMLLLRNAVKATHYKILDKCWKNILKGYKQEYKDDEQVIKKVSEIEGRARYAKR